MQVEFIIIGQGIAGTFLSYYLEKENRSFLVIDNNQPSAASRIAAGIINPVTGRRLVKTWMIDELLPFIHREYEELGKALSIKAITQKNIIEFFPSPFMRETFISRVPEESVYLELPPEENLFHHQFSYELGYGVIHRSFIVHLESLLPAWRTRLSSTGRLLEEDFDRGSLFFRKDSVWYKDFASSMIIFCDGISSAENDFFRNLPFAFNKGECLLVETELPAEHIYKKAIHLAPLEEKNLFWVGSSYAWNFAHADPTKAFLEQTEMQLKTWLKIPFRIVDHMSGIRPATLERRPFVGIHPAQKQVGILNGMGTKGCSLSPYFANQLKDHLVHGTGILPEADIKRFTGILERK